MGRKTPYTASLAIIDLVTIFLTGGIWLVIMLVRELAKRS